MYPQYWTSSIGGICQRRHFEEPFYQHLYSIMKFRLFYDFYF